MKILNIIGQIDIAAEFDKIFDTTRKFLITPIVGSNHYFELSGESMYNCLLEEENLYKIDNSIKKKSIINALLERRKECNGFYTHTALHGNTDDTQLRSTSAVIRTMLLGYRDGIIEKNIIEDVVHKHFKYFLNWNEGIWFCHDTSEYNNSGPKSHLKMSYLYKDGRNTVTLNTHFDSMTTLGLVLKECVLTDDNFYVDLYSKGLSAINYILLHEKSIDFVDNFLQGVDNLFVKRAFKKNHNIIDKLYSRIFHPFCFKILKPTIFFKNGFIGRDLAVMNIHVDYLIVNIVDILRFLKGYYSIKSEYDNFKLEENELFYRIHSAVRLVQENNFIIDYIHSNDLQKVWYVEMLYLYQNYNVKYLDEFKKYERQNMYVYKNYLLD